MPHEVSADIPPVLSRIVLRLLEREAERYDTAHGAALDFYDRTPTIDRLRNTSLPDADRIWLGAGATYAVSDRFEVDAAVNAAIFMDGRVDRTETVFGGTPVASEQRTTGTAALDFFTAAVGVRWRF